MPFLMNTWYCAGFSHELDEQPMIGRKFLGKSVLLMRKEDGEAVAMSNVCPHRFAPMSEGVRTGDIVSCPYHGLEFDANGKCVRNPGGDRSDFDDGPTPNASLKKYPLEEKWGIMFIWMGDAEKADPDLIPDYSMTEPREGHSVVYGHHVANAHYELVVDNLMDRTHVQIMHPAISIGTDHAPDFKRQHSMEQVGDTVWDYHEELNSKMFPLAQKAFWPDAPEKVHNWFDCRWDAPGNMLLDAGISEMDSDRKVGVNLPGANMITPVDEKSSHYFWNISRDKNINNPEIDEKVKAGVGDTFRDEDGAMVAMCQDLMDGEMDLMALNPILLPTDGAAIRARRILKEKIAAEQAEMAKQLESVA